MNPQLKLMLQQAIQAFRREDFHEADLILQEILKSDMSGAEAIFDLGIAYARESRFIESAAVFNCLQPHKGEDARIPYNLGLIYSLQGKHHLALAAYDLALKIQPEDVPSLVNKGSTYNDIQNYALALESLEKAIQLCPDIADAWSNKGIALNNLNLHEESLSAYNKAIQLNPNYFQAWSNKSVPLAKLNRYAEACEACDRAISLNADYAEAYYNKGNALSNLGRHAEAIACFDKAISLRPDYDEAWANKGDSLHDLKHYEQAVACYDKALSFNSNYAEAWANKGVALNDHGRYADAIACFDKAISLRPDYAENWSNRGNSLHELKHYEQAISCFDKALSLRPDYAEAWSNKGNSLNELKYYDKAIACYDTALSINPNIEWVIGDLLHAKMKMCSWSEFAITLEEVSRKIVANKKAIQPFSLLALNEDLSLHKKSSEIYAQYKFPSKDDLGNIAKHPRGKKIRIGYFSADFRNHAVSILTAELFELHNKNQFEIIAFSLDADDQSPMRLRLSRAFDQFIDVSNKSDLEIAQLARGLKVDIAVDLGGYTGNSRPGIFAYKSAPLQISYIGYLSTMGAKHYDYLLADQTIIPHSSESLYSEKIVYLPSYQVNDRKRLISEKKFSRLELGLPEAGFVFCCFNNNYKILPSTFDGWMRILKAVEGSVIFLYAENQWVENNLKQEAESRGINSSRLVFGGRLPNDQYLARYRACDLFLDTFPYNAGTTASDALWVGLPVLTLMGQSFASRMAASLLNAIGLPELITKTQESYELLAIELAKNPKKLADIKLKLARNRLTTPLFDAPFFTKNLEIAYIKMMERYQEGLQPDHIHVGLG